MKRSTLALLFAALWLSPLGAQRGSQTTHAPAIDALPIQVMLDRSHFSPGEIDGNFGMNTDKAIVALAAARGVTVNLGDRASLAAALGATGDPLTVYTITTQDAAGPFTERIPRDLMQQSELPALNYRSVLEAISEKFHSSPALLQRLNPGAGFGEGQEIRVPNVAGGDEAAAATPAGDVTVTVSKHDSSLAVRDGAGRVLMYAPVTSGSEHDPLPIGTWSVTGVQRNPAFNYNPDLFWDANPEHSKAKIPPGPNGPVGVVWIGLNKEHYGIHGSPEPNLIGRTTSHGCVRLTNWDALRLAALVKKGTAVVFQE